MASNSAIPVVLTIGVFDGVHAGHRALLAHASDRARMLGGTVTAATFEPHPTSFLRPEVFLGLLTLVERRKQLLLDAGADSVDVLHFDAALSQMTPADFVQRIVVEQLKASLVIVGTNFRFGHSAEGDVTLLKFLGLKYGFDVEVFALVGDDGSWSSTRVRQAILDGDVEIARGLLGRPHRLTGTVVHGDHRGRELGFPTANLDMHGGLVVPADGVYSGVLHTATESHPAAISIGTNPTFDGVVGRRVEAHVIGRLDLDLYDHVVDVDFVGSIRGMLAFTSVEELIVAMHRDVEVALKQIDEFNSAK